MSKTLLLVCFVFSGLLAEAQLIIQPLRRPDTQTGNNQRVSQVLTPLALPFWDDFSYANDSPDTSIWQTSQDIFVNAQLASNAVTLNTATFDGVKNTGQAHNIASSFNAAGDSLISKPIDLSTVSDFNKNTVYFSFFWQAQGFGELPDDSDSIRLQFLAKENDSTYNWISQWQQVGGTENVYNNFRYEEIQITDNQYFHDAFQVKFQSFSTLQGPLDVWYLDYVYLNENRSANDSVFVDRSLSGSLGPLFGPYYQIPAKSFFRDPQSYLSQQSILVSNLDDQVQPTDMIYTIYNETSGETYLDFVITNAGLVNPGEVREVNGPDPTTTPFNIPSFTGDSLVISSSFSYNTGDTLLYEITPANDTIYSTINLRVNDTIKNYYTLHNQYAYDDGVAEYAAGVNSNNAMVAIAFGINELDTFAVTHIDIYFPNIAPDATGKNVDIILWERLANTGIKARQPFTIKVPTKLNEFARIKLEQPVLVSDTFYIGYQQFIDNYIGVGLDKSNTFASDKIYTNIEGTWEQNDLLSGTLMIRPVFDIDPQYVLSSGDKPESINKVYPNPSKGVIHFNEKIDRISVYDLAGHEVFKGLENDRFSLDFLVDGVYLLKIYSNNRHYSQKLIIEK